MSLQQVTAGERLHIGFFGMRNAGKSSLVNAVTGQNLSVVSDTKGTTTDPVKKTMELLPLGPVVIIDTPGLDDEGDLGALRIQKTKEMLHMTDIAVLVVDAAVGMSAKDNALKSELQKRNIPFVVVFNKADTIEEKNADTLYVSAQTGEGIETLKEKLGAFAREMQKTKVPVSDMLQKGDMVILVTPIDEAAPKGRLILPQQLVLRDILDAHATALVCQPAELSEMLASLTHAPRMVITDSQVFGAVSKMVPPEIPLTSFSILMARYKGDLGALVAGAAALKNLKDGDRVLIAEGCTHHRQCNDIGTVKMPAWIKEFCGANPQFSFTSGGEYPENLTDFAAIVHCGGCMLNDAAMQHRINAAKQAGVPLVNYGIAIAAMHGILKRSLELFPDVLKLLE